MQDFLLCACMRPSSAAMLSIAPLNAAVRKGGKRSSENGQSSLAPLGIKGSVEKNGGF